MIIGNLVCNIGLIFDTVINVSNFKLRKVKYKKHLYTNGIIFVRNKGIINIGNEVKINSKLSSNPIGGDNKTILVCLPGANIEIGDRTGISNSCVFSAIKIRIGNDVLIGGGTKIYDTDHHSLNPVFRMQKKDPDIAASPVTIKDRVFIGGHCIVLKGVTIGENSIVGAGSVVTKNIPSNQIWAGNPARFIKNIDITRLQKDQ
jgi:acetyltransferase-like isoleucine patch superfamily enzyme